jgi:hypothetical protein
MPATIRTPHSTLATTFATARRSTVAFAWRKDASVLPVENNRYPAPKTATSEALPAGPVPDSNA